MGLDNRDWDSPFIHRRHVERRVFPNADFQRLPLVSQTG